MTRGAEFRVLNDEELTARLSESKQELFQLRFELATGQLVNTARLSEVKSDIARINTVLRENEIKAAEELSVEGAK